MVHLKGRENQATPKTQSSHGLMLHLLGSNKSLLLAGILFWTGHYLTMWNPLTVAQGYAASIPNPVFLAATGLPPFIMGLLALTSRSSKNSFASRRWMYLLALACVLAGLLMVILLSSSLTALSTVGMLLLTAGTGISLALCAELHAQSAPSALLLIIAIELISGTAIYLALLWVPPTVAISIGLLCAVAALVVMNHISTTRKKLQPPKLTTRTNTVKPPTSPTLSDPPIIDLMPLQIASLAFLIGLSYAIIKNFLSHTDPSWVLGSAPFEMLGSFLAGLILILVFNFLNNRSLLQKCFIVVIPLISLGMISIPLYTFNTYLPIIVHNAGFVCFLGLLWYYASVISKTIQRHNSAFLVTGFLFFMTLGQVLGVLLPTSLANYISSEIIFLFMLILTVIFIRQKRRTSPPPISTTTDLTSNFAKAIGLSPRESQVLALLIERAPYKQIEQKLTIAPNTVKSHVNNIYHKAGVTSREQLLAKVKTFNKIQ